MKKATLVAALCAASSCQAFGADGDSVIWSSVARRIASAWTVSFPTGSADYFHVAYDVVPGVGNVDGDTLADGLPITGLSVAVTDAGSGRTYPRVGVFQSNLTLDSSGFTPDLASPVAVITDPVFTPPPLYQFTTFDLPETTIPSGTTRLHAAVQLPPGDTGLLGVGGDTAVASTGRSGFTSDGYSTPAQLASSVEFGLNPGQDNSWPSSCKVADHKPHGRLRYAYGRSPGTGNHLTVSFQAGDRNMLTFYGTRTGDRFRVYYSSSPCLPLTAVGPVLSTTPDPDGDGSYLRLNTAWPSGFGALTFRFAAAWGNPSCVAAGVGFTNCVTVISQPDQFPGACDDGTIESGWVVQSPSGSSDYVNNDLGFPFHVNNVTSLAVAVLDFGTTTAAFPSAGVSNPNFGLDATGVTPDVSGAGLLACVCPFTFPPGTLATTSAQYVSHALAVPGTSLASHVHAWLQFPPGDAGFLYCGVDSSTASQDCSFFSIDGYATPAINFYANLAIRLTTN